MAKKANEKRLGLRIDADLKLRVKQVALQMETEALKAHGEESGEESGTVSVKSLTEDALRFYLDFLEAKGEETLLAVQEIIEIGNDTDRRTLKSCVGQVLQGARARAERKSKTGA